MLGLWQRATLFRRTGMAGGRPVYTVKGVAFTCRAEPVRGASAGGQRVAGRLTVKLYAEDIGAAPGDRIVLPDGGAAILTEVAACAGPGGIHHVEMLAEGESGHG